MWGDISDGAISSPIGLLHSLTAKASPHRLLTLAALQS